MKKACDCTNSEVGHGLLEIDVARLLAHLSRNARVNGRSENHNIMPRIDQRISDIGKKLVVRIAEQWTVAEELVRFRRHEKEEESHNHHCNRQ